MRPKWNLLEIKFSDIAKAYWYISIDFSCKLSTYSWLDFLVSSKLLPSYARPLECQNLGLFGEIEIALS